IRLPRELDIGLLCQHHALLGKGRGVVAVARRQIRDGVDIGVSALHGERYTRFVWNVLVFMMGGLGSPKLYVSRRVNYSIYVAPAMAAVLLTTARYRETRAQIPSIRVSRAAGYPSSKFNFPVFRSAATQTPLPL